MHERKLNKNLILFYFKTKKEHLIKCSRDETHLITTIL
ncbi:hypothetical protein BCAH1134_C0480 (plasmid) [Bacillus cereus AH1134]|nr:hypothetical protein BCAH1134_C0480 [Bacillus cereus AH1134]